MSDAPHRLQFDQFELDEGNARLTRDGRPISLPPKAFALLCALVRQPGRLTKKDALLDAVWGHRHVSESVLKTTVSQLRAALADDAGEPRYIETVSRHGYRFIGHIAAPTAAGQSAAVMPAPLPTSDEISAIIGRDTDLTKLRQAWSRAQAGQRQLVWVVGEAGVGKSTLIKRFSDEVPADVLAVGNCVEHFGTGEPYLPLLEALRAMAAREPELPALMRAVAPTWIVQMPWLVGEADRAILQRELAGAHPDRMLREMRELLDRLTSRRPMILVSEDLHWSDLGTLRMMEHFARQSGPMKLLWIASFRLTQVIAEDHPLHQLRQELRLHKLCEEIQLDSFSESEVNDYLAQRLPQARISEDFVRRLHAHTEGLPLFVANVADALFAQAEGDAPSAEWLNSASNQPLPVPDNLAGVIEKQARRLSTEVQALLQAASACGMEFRASSIAKLMDRDSHWASEQCDELVGRRLWLRHVGIDELPDGGFDSRYAFLHAFYQHVFYQRIAASQRVQYHRRVAAELESRRAAGEPFALAELASHYERGHETFAALRSYSEAAHSALAHFAPKDAGQLAMRGLSLLDRCPDNLERKELELNLARPAGIAATLIHGVASNEARSLFERVRALFEQLPQTPERAIALNGMGWVHYVRGEFDQALALATRLQEVAVRHDNPVLFVFASNLMGVSLVARGEFVAGSECLERGIEKCRQFGDKMPPAALVIDSEVSMRANLAVPLFDRGLVDQARSQLKLAIERAERIGQPIARMLAHWASGMVAVRANHPEAVAQHAAALDKVVEDAVLAQGEGPSLWLRGWAEARLGEPRAGHARILQGYQRHARLGMYAGCPEVLCYAVDALLLAGDWDAAQQQLDEALQLAEHIGERLILANAKLLGARIALGKKDHSAAQALMHESLCIAREQQALGLELKALVALAELQKPKRDDLDALKTAYQKMSEGFDTPAYHRAGELLTAHA